MEFLFEWIGTRFPEGTRAAVRDMLRFAGMPYYGRAKLWLGATISYSLLFALLIAAAVLLLGFRPLGIPLPASSLLFFILPLSLSLFIAYLSLYYKLENRRERAEASLPDFLSLAASNIRSGMTPIIAIRSAARPEFEPLTGELLYITNKSLGVGSFSDELLEVSSAIKSELLERTMLLFATSIISGGNVPAILESAANEMRETQRLKQKLVSGVNIYVIFILFTIVVGMPLLFAVSVKFVEMLVSLSSSQAELSLTAASPSVSAGFVTQLSLATLVLTSLLASMLIGVVRDGKELLGLRYALPLALSSLLAFLIFKSYILAALIPAV